MAIKKQFEETSTWHYCDGYDDFPTESGDYLIVIGLLGSNYMVAKFEKDIGFYLEICGLVDQVCSKISAWKKLMSPSETMNHFSDHGNMRREIENEFLK